MNKNQVPRVSQCSKYDRTVLTKVLKGRLANWDGKREAICERYRAPLMAIVAYTTRFSPLVLKQVDI